MQQQQQHHMHRCRVNLSSIAVALAMKHAMASVFLLKATINWWHHSSFAAIAMIATIAR